MPGDGAAFVDREVPERFDEVRFPASARAADDEDFGAVDPFEVRSAFCVWVGITEDAASQASNVLPAGRPEARRRIEMVAWSRPAASSASRTLRTSACSQRWLVAVAITSGAARRTYGIRSRRRSRSSSSGSGGGAGGLTVIAGPRSVRSVALAGRRSVAATSRRAADRLPARRFRRRVPIRWFHCPNPSQLRVERCSERSSGARWGSGITVAVCWWARMLARSPSANRP